MCVSLLCHFIGETELKEKIEVNMQIYPEVSCKMRKRRRLKGKRKKNEGEGREKGSMELPPRLPVAPECLFPSLQILWNFLSLDNMKHPNHICYRLWNFLRGYE